MIKHLQKVAALALVGFAFVSATDANAQIIYEPFNYTVGSNLGGQSTWTNVNSGDEIVVVDENLFYNNLKASEGKSVSFDGGGVDPQLTFDKVTTGTTYFSFLFKVTALGTLDETTGGYFAGLGATTTSFGSTIWLRKSGEGFNIGFSKRTSTSEINWLPNVYALNETVMVVGSYQLLADAGNDVAKFWINPTAGTSVPAANFEVTTGTDIDYVERFFLRQDSNTETPFLVVDELRIGATWEAVTPAATTTGIADATKGMFSVYPNPVQYQNVRLALPGHVADQKVSLTVHSVEGKVLFQSTGSQLNVQQSLNEKIASLPKGMFFVNLAAGKDIYQTKLLKN